MALIRLWVNGCISYNYNYTGIFFNMLNFFEDLSCLDRLVTGEAALCYLMLREGVEVALRKWLLNDVGVLRYTKSLTVPLNLFHNYYVPY